GILDPLIKKGVVVVFLPVYFSDFNPIELAWSKIKAYLRKVRPRVLEDLYRAISEALTTITNIDVDGWVKHCCYGL
ncbi:MAG: IS630 family transposase, partial [Nitrososphaerota archaeon]|nr:IS630 family transposase [Nitrososphaerota archaeon]